MPVSESSTLYNERPCLNYRHCGGSAVAGRALCVYCIEADEIEKAQAIERQLHRLEKKPRNIQDVMR